MTLYFTDRCPCANECANIFKPKELKKSNPKTDCQRMYEHAGKLSRTVDKKHYEDEGIKAEKTVWSLNETLLLSQLYPLQEATKRNRKRIGICHHQYNEVVERYGNVLNVSSKRIGQVKHKINHLIDNCEKYNRVQE